MSSTVNKARVHFHHNGDSYADFQGSLTLLNGLIPDDLRDTPVAQNNTSVGHGKVKVTIANKVWYCNDSLVFKASGIDPNNDTEKWDYNPAGEEEVMIMWKNNVQYQANNDSQVVKSVYGTLVSRFIHQDKTELRWNYQGVALPATLSYNGLVVVSLNASGVASPGPGAISIDQHGTVVDFDMALQLKPGDTVSWTTAKPASYTQTIGSGTAMQVYYNAGGSFDIRVPRMDNTIVNTCTPLLATVEFQVGDSVTACTTFSIAPNDPFKCESDEHWKFHDDDDE
jgi:plastocyanin